MDEKTPETIDANIIRNLASTVEENPEILELLVNTWNIATWFANKRNSQMTIAEKDGSQ